MNKSKLTEILEYNDIQIDIEQINQVINIIDYNTQLSDDDVYIFDEWAPIKEIEKITGLSIDDIFDGWGFSDEWILCDHCCNAIHTNTYCQLPDYWLNDDGITCRDCIRNNDDLIDVYIEDLINNPERANTLLTNDDLENKNFKVCSCDDKECLFTAGWNWHDDPKEILKNAIKENPNKEFIFSINSIGQFDLDFTIFSRSVE